MATSDEALNVARGELGNGPDKYWYWYNGGSGYAWCCAFQSWVLSTVGIPTHYAYVSYLFNEYRNAGRTFAPHEAQPGDLVAFDYDGGGPSNYDHIAMVESVDDRGITAINGNWKNRVQRVLHRWQGSGYAAGIAEIARPTYSTIPTPPPPGPEEDEEMKSVILWDPRNGRAWHCFGNTRVALSDPDQVNTLAFLGVQQVNPAPAGWVDAYAIIPRNGGVNTPGN